ncbi:unnamed protein product, partial [Pylaiella littoralis]
TTFFFICAIAVCYSVILCGISSYLARSVIPLFYQYGACIISYFVSTYLVDGHIVQLLHSVHVCTSHLQFYLPVRRLHQGNLFSLVSWPCFVYGISSAWFVVLLLHCC